MCMVVVICLVFNGTVADTDIGSWGGTYAYPFRLKSGVYRTVTIQT